MRFSEISSENLFEAILGKLAIAYHRTHNIKGTKGIGETGFKAGTGAMYGTGVYQCGEKTRVSSGRGMSAAHLAFDIYIAITK